MPCHIFVTHELYTRRMFIGLCEELVVLNRMREMASRACIANDIDSEAFLMSAEHVLPAEMMQLFSGKPRGTHGGMNNGKAGLTLDEHELALS
jgi:hypothetical protein